MNSIAAIAGEACARERENDAGLTGLVGEILAEMLLLVLSEICVSELSMLIEDIAVHGRADCTHEARCIQIEDGTAWGRTRCEDANHG